MADKKGNNTLKSVKKYHKRCHENQITYVKHEIQYKRSESETTCPLFNTEEDTTKQNT